MDTREENIFQKAVRLCKERDCWDCPVNTIIGDNSCVIECLCDIPENKTFDHQIDVLNKWAGKNPPHKQKTYKDVFLEKFPKALLTDIGLPDLCPDYCFGEGNNDPRCANDEEDSCEQCWNRPYPEGNI